MLREESTVLQGREGVVTKMKGRDGREGNLKGWDEVARKMETTKGAA